ncbi:MAG TPA: DUF433 domain-containing protein [Pyrinomonadaceae bacterium]|nr:DUF433 domain-containing protein [Pyrinomonadaceae bacterium]
MSIATAYEHITLSENGVPMIEGTTTKIVEIVLETKAYGWSPEEVHFQHPYLSLGQIYSAMAYYFDHSQEFEREIRERLEKVGNIRASLGESKVQTKLEEKGLL